MRRDVDPQMKAPPPPSTPVQTDVLIVGAGFSGCYMLHKLRQAGFSAKIVEAGDGYGGVWHWNCYPGARVDSPVPIYEYDIPEVWKSWSWPEMFPSGAQIQEYFNHADKVLDLRKDTIWNTKVVTAAFESQEKIWKVGAQNGARFIAKNLIMATGFAARRSFPDWPGIEEFKGEIHHSSFWPHEGIDLSDKRVAVIGTGSTGLQIAQSISDRVEELVVFQRSPNMALPLLQTNLVQEEEQKRKDSYPAQFKQRLTTFAGYPYDNVNRSTFDDTPEEREAFFESLWQKGGFHFWLATYNDVLSIKDANNEAYQFWAKKVRVRIRDTSIADVLAPKQAPYPFGTKRPALEWKWYDMFNEPGNRLVDISNNPVQRVEGDGIRTSDGVLHKVDVIALATGFDAITGGLKAIDIKSRTGETLSEAWDDGVRSALGLMVSGFPNLFMLYGPQGPTAFANGPSCVEVQGDWVVDVLRYMRDQEASIIEATPTAERRWYDLIETNTNKTLFPLADSWYMGANIPGKRRQMLNFTGGIPAYIRELDEARENRYEEFYIA